MSAETHSTTDERDVVAYLRSHPDFFRRHTALLQEMHVPHPNGGGAISLLERQVILLREQKRDVERKLRELAQSAYENELLLDRIRALMVELIGLPDADSVIQRLDAILREEFHADAVSLKLFSARPRRPCEIPPDAPGVDTLGYVVKYRSPICGHLKPAQLQFLFGDQPAPASAVVIPLSESKVDECLGLLAIGSDDPRRFHPEMGTQFVAHLGALLARVLRAHLRG